MKWLNLTLFLFGLLGDRTKLTRAQNQLRTQSQESDSRILCTLFSTPHLTLPGKAEVEPTFSCITDDGKAKTVINIPDNFFQINDFKSGETQISVLASGIVERKPHQISDAVSRYKVIDMTAGSGKVDMTAGSGKVVSNNKKCNGEDVCNLAVIRVSDAYGNSPDYNAAEISDHLFGTSGDPLSLVTGYQQCSGGKLNISPATGNSFSDGIMEFVVGQNIAGLDSHEVEWLVTEALDLVAFDETLYTLVMYVLPAGVDFKGSSAWANLGGHISVFSNTYVSKHYVQIHELGHNFGHHHSAKMTSKGANVYGDSTGMMGKPSYEDDAPRMCFNAAKSWYFGWYSDRHVEVTPTSGSMVLNMISIDGYLDGHATSDDQYTVARIVESQQEDLFIMYNRAEGINSEVLGFRDQVTIIRQAGPMCKSWFQVGLGLDGIVPSNYTESNWNGSGNDLIVKICDQEYGSPDYARIIVYLEGVNDISCDNSCGLGMAEFTAGIFTDDFGDEIGWTLNEIDDTGASHTILNDNYLPSNTHVEETMCISESKCYKFEIRDEGEDGICCGEGDGWYEIKINETILKHSPFEGLPREITEFCNPGIQADNFLADKFISSAAKN